MSEPMRNGAGDPLSEVFGGFPPGVMRAFGEAFSEPELIAIASVARSGEEGYDPAGTKDGSARPGSLQTQEICNRLYLEGFLTRAPRSGYILSPPRTLVYQLILFRLGRVAKPAREAVQEYFMQGILDRFDAAKTHVFKVLPYEEVLPVTERHLIVPYSRASEILAASDPVVAINCVCRSMMGLCDAPLQVCLNLGDGARFFMERGIGRVLHQDEAQALLRSAADKGLVHCIDNPAMRSPTHVICNCCHCCCVYMRGLRVYGRPMALTNSG